MAERTFSAMSAAGVTTAPPTKIVIAAGTLKVMQQLHVSYDGPPMRIIEWGVSMDGSTAAPGVQAELIEVDVAATGGTSYKVPVAILNTALTSGTTTVVPFTNAGFPGSGSYLARILREEILVTAGQGTNSWTVTRGVNGVAQAFTIPTGTPIWGVDVPPQDIVPDNSSDLWAASSVMEQMAWDAAYGVTSVSGFGFTTPNTPTRTRTLAPALIVPDTAPFAIQEPLSRESEAQPGMYVQVRLTSPASTGPTPGCLTWIKWAE